MQLGLVGAADVGNGSAVAVVAVPGMDLASVLEAGCGCEIVTGKEMEMESSVEVVVVLEGHFPSSEFPSLDY